MMILNPFNFSAQGARQFQRRQPTMEPLFYTYCIYIALSILLTIWVAHTLFKHGRVFLVDIFKGNEKLADSVNHLLVVGFYLVNLGYDSFALKAADPVNSSVNAIEVLSTKIGLVLLVLGILHFTNLFLFSMIRRAPQPRTPR